MKMYGKIYTMFGGKICMAKVTQRARKAKMNVIIRSSYILCEVE